MNTNTPGYAAALADNPDCAALLAALAAAPERDVAPLAPRVLAAIRARAVRAARLRRLGAGLAAAAVAAAVVLATPPSDRPAAPDRPAAGPSSVSPLSLAARQRPDGSWAADRGGEAMAPAATALAMLELAAGAAGDPAAAAALERGAAWLRAHQNADGSFGAAPADSAAGAYNLALGATALLRLYEAGGRSDLFTPIDGAVGAIRARLARPAAAGAADVPLASALALADALEWPDENAGDLRRAVRRIDGAGFAPVASAPTFEGKRDALRRLAGRI